MIKEYLLHWQNDDFSFMFAWYSTKEELQNAKHEIIKANGKIFHSGKVKHIKQI